MAIPSFRIVVEDNKIILESKAVNITVEKHRLFLNDKAIAYLEHSSLVYNAPNECSLRFQPIIDNSISQQIHIVCSISRINKGIKISGNELTYKINFNCTIEKSGVFGTGNWMIFGNCGSEYVKKEVGGIAEGFQVVFKIIENQIKRK